MTEQRSPFGELLRYHRRRLGMSQEGLAKHIIDLGLAHPEIASLGVIGEKGIANLEKAREDPAEFVRPRPATVRLLSVVFGLVPGTEEYAAFWSAAGLTELPESELWSETERKPPAAMLIASERLPREPHEFVANGREVQLAQLVGALDVALAGQPRLLVVSGESGIGKTSLIAEMARRAVAAHPQLVVIWSECTGKFGNTDAFQPLRQALNIMIGDARAASPSQLISTTNQHRLYQRAPSAIQALAVTGDSLVGRFIGAEAVIAQADALGVRPGSWQTRLRQLAHRPHTPGPGEGDEQFVRLLQQYAEDGPVVLVIEDLHWANHDLARVLFHLLRRLRGQTTYPIFIVGSYRPAELAQEAEAGRHPVAALIDEAHQMFELPVVDLGPTIGSAPGRAFVNGVIDRDANTIGQDFRDLVFARTGGHPYFTLELLRWFRARGTLVRDERGVWRAGTIPAEPAIPEGIAAVIRERLSLLPPDLRRLLRLASVQGEVFNVEVLAASTGYDAAELAELLDGELIQRFQLLSGGGVTMTGGLRVHQYRFAHALFQEHIYASLTDAERERIHEQTATAMLELFGAGTNEAAPEIAVHFDRAGRWREAAAAYKDAGDYAVRQFEFRTATQFFQRAIELAEQEGMTDLAAQCQIGLANCGREMGDERKATEHAERAIALARSEGISFVEGEALFILGLVDFDAGRHARAAARLAAAIPMFGHGSDTEETCRARTMLSHALYGQGDYDEALRQAEAAAEIAGQLNNDWLAVDAQVAAANCQTDLGLFREAIESYAQGATRARAIGHRRNLALCLINTALCRVERAEWELADDGLEDVLALTKDGSMPRTRASAETYLGLLAEGRGDIDIAARHYAAAVELRQATGQETLAQDAIAGQLRVATAEGNLPRIRHLMSELTAWLDQRGVTGIEFPVRLYLSLYRAELAQGNQAAAEKWLEEANALLTERASHIADEAARRSYLEQVPAHRELHDLLAARLGAPIADTRPVQSADR